VNTETKTDKPLVVSLRGVSKTYGDTRVIEKVSFEIKQGEILALLGGARNYI